MLENKKGDPKNQIFGGKSCSCNSIIQGQVMFKKNIHEYRNQRGSGKVFGFDLVNDSHDEMHISAFNELALSLYDQIQIGEVYIVSNGTVKASNPIFNHLKSHNEIFLGSSSTIQPCLDKYPLIPLHCFNFKTIQDIQTIPVNSMVDLLGLVFSVSFASSIRKRDGVETV